MLKIPLFLSNSCHFVVHKSEISKFLARIHMKYFQMGIFVIPVVCLIRKYGYRNTAFFSVFQSYSGYRDICIHKAIFIFFFTMLILGMFSNHLLGSLKDCQHQLIVRGPKIVFIISLR